MWTGELFAKVLCLEKPWIVTKVEFTEERSETRSKRGIGKHAEAEAVEQNSSEPEAETQLLRSIMSGQASGELHIYIDFEQGSKFPYPVEDTGSETGSESDQQCMLGVYDVKNMEWRHLNFWQYRTYIHARVPRVGDKNHSPKIVAVPWARIQSGFTLL